MNKQEFLQKLREAGENLIADTTRLILASVPTARGADNPLPTTNEVKKIMFGKGSLPEIRREP